MTAAHEWPALPLAEWHDTYRNLHMCTQMVGKVRLALSPAANEMWHVTLHPTVRGLTTGPMPYGPRSLQIDIDLRAHEIVLATADGLHRRVPLGGPVRAVHAALTARLDELGMPVPFSTTPVEVTDGVPFDRDDRPGYDGAYAETFHAVLLRAHHVFSEFRGRFTGKCSPVHFFWGAFDLAVTRFSGRRADPPPGADAVTRVSYDAELSSLGFWPGGAWPGGAMVDGPVFYSYTYPEPAGYSEGPARPAAARYDDTLGEFILTYDDVRRRPDPAADILAFAQSTYEAGARRQGWDLAALARDAGDAEGASPPVAAPDPRTDARGVDTPAAGDTDLR